MVSSPRTSRDTFPIASNPENDNESTDQPTTNRSLSVATGLNIATTATPRIATVSRTKREELDAQIDALQFGEEITAGPSSAGAFGEEYDARNNRNELANNEPSDETNQALEDDNASYPKKKDNDEEENDSSAEKHESSTNVSQDATHVGLTHETRNTIDAYIESSIQGKICFVIETEMPGIISLAS